ITTPWVAGDWVFVVTDEAKVVAMSRASGKVRWINELPRWENPKGKKGLIYYSGPILAGSRLIVVGSNGTLININPTNGSFQNQTNVGGGVSVPPVVAGGTLYILTDSGRLIAYR
ncbi:MAG: PQQ-binding-like beta-propeller repeat protein, partial [Sphingomicrobium sp.]